MRVSRRPGVCPGDVCTVAPMPETLNSAAAALVDAVGRYRYAAAQIDRARPAASRTSITEREALRYLRAAATAAGEEPCTPKRLGEHLGISTSSTTSLLDRLEASGFLTRVPNPTDRRSSYVQLTPGTPDRNDTDPLAPHIEALCAGVPQADAATIARFLTDLAALAPDTTP